MSPKKPGEKAPPATNFEEALARLEAIVQELEGKDLTLEETLARYEEGSRLVGECTRRLEDAEQRIRVLSEGGTRDGEGGEEGKAGDEAAGGEADDGLPF